VANLKDVKSKPVKITLTDGVERTLRFTLNAMAELEDKYGSVDAAFAKLDEGSIKAVRFILWAGLIHEDPDLTEQQVGNLIDIQYMQELMSSVGDALDSDMPVSAEPAKLTDGSTSDPNA
jgi:hypothetical protein